MATKAYPLRIPDGLIALAEAKAQEDRTDRATALRRLLYAGAEDFVLELLAQGRITVSRAGELLDTSPYRIYELAEAASVDLSATLEQYEQARETARSLLRQST